MYAELKNGNGTGGQKYDENDEKNDGLDLSNGFVGECMEFCETGRVHAEAEDAAGGLKDGKSSESGGREAE